jgi:hypothetical protein
MGHAGIRQLMTVCSLTNHLGAEAIGSLLSLKAEFPGATNCHATKCRIHVYDITTQWYIGNLIFTQRQINLQQIVPGAVFCFSAPRPKT